jgi:hypothetical protein
VQTN